jgi:hypothetical protein
MASVFESMFATAGAPAVAGVHGKTLSFLPKGGSARDIDAIAIHSDVTQLAETKAGLFWEDGILVSATKDPVRGIDAIKLGDGVKFNNRGYSFSGQILDELSDSWTIRFVSRRPYELGGNRLER